MRRSYPIILALILVLALAGASEAKKHKAPAADPGYPGKAQTHQVILQKVLLSDFDLTRDTTGATRSIIVELLEDGNVIVPSNGDTTITGMRGEHLLETPVQWLVNYDPRKNYQVIITEQLAPGATNTGNRIMVPATPKAGYWPFGVMAGKVPFGKESYLQFVDKPQ
ncbi:MAG TPA: hypothetical protein VGL38_08795 [bacterium]|jgi:hypothetical protein